MKRRCARERRCTYLVSLESPGEDVHELAAYLSKLSIADFEVVIVDTSENEEHRRVLRWVGKYIVAKAGIDPMRTALGTASCEKVILADAQVRYDENALDHLCVQLDLHDVVEPQSYFDPLPWWGGLEAGSILLHRGASRSRDRSATFAFRKKAVRHRGLQFAETFSATDIFVRRNPPALEDWLRERPRSLEHAAFFFGLPLALILALLGGTRWFGAYAGAVVLCSLAVAIRGRIGAAEFFPLRACLYAPLWLLERSISAYWALFLELMGTSRADKVPALVRGERITGAASSTANTR